MPSLWVLLSRNEGFVNTQDIRLAGRPPLNNLTVPLWTDDFASLYQILRSDPVAQKDPEFTDAEGRAALTLCQQGDFAAAIDRLRHDLKTLPRSPILLGNLAFLLTTCPDQSLRNIPEATRLAIESCRLTHYNNPEFLSCLAIVYSEAGRFPEAIFMTEKACALGTDLGQQALVQKNQELLVLYRNHQPYHDLAKP
jgi:tetratricopeptide (TPR) repeat protein